MVASAAREIGDGEVVFVGMRLPLIAFVYDRWGFDTLFRVLAVTALVILVTVSLLPRQLPTPAAAVTA